MTGLQRYIAEEIATDHIDGLLTRREALRRLAAVLGIYGALDIRVTGTKPAAEAALDRAGPVHELVVDRMPTTRSSTTPPRGTTPSRLPTPGNECWTGSTVI